MNRLQFSFLRFKLKEEPYIQSRDRRHANCGTVLKTCHLLLRLTCIFSQVVGVFHMVYCEDKKKNFCSSEYVMKGKCLSLHKSDCILATESRRVNINISISCMTKNIRRHNGCTNFIYFRTSGIYTLSLRITVPRKVPIAKIWGSDVFEQRLIFKVFICMVHLI